MVPTLLAVLASALMTRDVKRVSGLWLLYEASRLVGYIGIVIAAGLTISAAVRRVSSILLIVLMTLSIGGARSCSGAQPMLSEGHGERGILFRPESEMGWQGLVGAHQGSIRRKVRAIIRIYKHL